MLKIQIPVHPGGATHTKAALRMSWQPGQHVFVRFMTLGLHAFTKHPFTICSLPPSRSNGEPCELVLYVQPASGFTARLAALAQRSPGVSVPILLDGPYGGLNIKSLAQFDRALLIAGGSGVGFTLPIIEDILSQNEQEKCSEGHTTSVQVVLVTRSHEVKAWYIQEVESIISKYHAAEHLHVEVHVTQSESDSQSPLSSGDKKGVEDGRLETSDKKPSADVTAHTGRPNLQQIIEKGTAVPGETIGIAVCGPGTMVFDVREACATAQGKILHGKGAREVYLHSEGFS
jgi:ferric-chelate reductase